MPLPDGGKTPWPPVELRPVFDRLHTWSAWYAGDPDTLSRIYGGDDGGSDIVNRPSQFYGGLVGRVARWFWGEPLPAGERRTKLHIPIAGDIARTSANLLFSEPPSITIKDTATQARLNELTDDRLHQTLRGAADVQAGLGGVYLRVVWDQEQFPEGPWLAPVHADGAAPEFLWDRLIAVTFWRVIHRDDDGVVRHLERHEPGVIRHGVYIGDNAELGRRVPLEEFGRTAPLAEQIDTDGDGISTGTQRITAVYVPNQTPNRVWRHLSSPNVSPLGRSDYAGIEGEMDALDETWSSLMRDIRLGKGRIVAPSAFLEHRGPGKGARFDPEREVYSALEMLPSPEASKQLTVVQFAIRTEEHLRAAVELTKLIVGSAGYSHQTFGLAGDVAVTAREVNARERVSALTRDDKILNWRPELAGILETLLEVDRTHFGSRITPQRPDIAFGDSVSEDPKSVAETVQLLAAAEAASIRTRVAMVKPDWDEQQLDAEVARILAEAGRVVEDPGTFRGSSTVDGAGNTPADTPAVEA